MEIRLMPMPRKPRTFCIVCGNETKRPFTKTCSNSCEQEKRYKKFIEKWKSGDESGIVGFDQVSNYIRKYLTRKFNNACQDCRWSKVNPITNKFRFILNILMVIGKTMLKTTSNFYVPIVTL